MTDLLSYIDQIDQSIADAEISVIESLIASYNKSIMIIQESAEDADLSVFEIFQEGEILDAAKGDKSESLIKRILLFIPRLIKAIWKKITSKRVKQADAVVDKVVKTQQQSMDDIKLKLKSDQAPKFYQDTINDVIEEYRKIRDLLAEGRIDPKKAGSITARLKKINDEFRKKINAFNTSTPKEYSYTLDELQKVLLQMKNDLREEFDGCKIDSEGLSKICDEFAKEHKSTTDQKWVATEYKDLVDALLDRAKILDEYSELLLTEWISITNQAKTVLESTPIKTKQDDHDTKDQHGSNAKMNTAKKLE